MSNYRTLHNITLYDLILNCIGQDYITICLYCIVSCHIISFTICLHYIIIYSIILPYIAPNLFYAILHYITSHHSTSHHIILYHSASRYITVYIKLSCIKSY